MNAQSEKFAYQKKEDVHVPFVGVKDLTMVYRAAVRRARQALASQAASRQAPLGRTYTHERSFDHPIHHRHV
jgi:hypothetical protein